MKKIVASCILLAGCLTGFAQSGTIKASSQQSSFPAKLAYDGDAKTFWVSGNKPSKKNPAWLELSFDAPKKIETLKITGKKRYGPHKGEIQVSSDGANWESAATFTMGDGEVYVTKVGKTAKHLRVLVYSAYDRGALPAQARNVQVTEIKLNVPITPQYVLNTFFTDLPSLALDAPETGKTWVDAMATANELKLADSTEFSEKMWRAFPLMCDWFIQDNTVHVNKDDAKGFDARGDFKAFLAQGRDLALEQQLVRKVATELGTNIALPSSRRELLTLYTEFCFKRRAERLAELKKKTRSIIYAKHLIAGMPYLTTETASCPDGSELRAIELTPDGVKDQPLFDSNNGIVRDPELSFDGKNLLFAWRKTNKNENAEGRLIPATGNYKIYEMRLADKQLRALTDDRTYGADLEPCYLPDGNIMFSSIRCVQQITCGGGGECSNLYLMDKDGKYARRVGFDQTQTAFPHLLDDGRVIYTRRDYNDRGQSYAHALFTMNPDGTTQTEYYGNNSMAPTSIQHTRQIPGTGKTMGIAGGYHTSQGGKLVIIDPAKGRQNYEGLTFINWTPTPLHQVNNENYCRVGEQYSYPYPLDDQSLLVSFEPTGAYAPTRVRYKLYYMTLDGKREMLASDPTLSCAQALPVMPRKRPAPRGTGVDYTKDTARMYVQNVYYGPGSKGIKPGTIKKIRVNEIFYKPGGAGAAGWGPNRKEVGPGRKYASYGWHSLLPAGVGSATFDCKQILGEVDVHEDGSAMFEIPARTPVYLQMIDANGDAVQTMRSWATLMPNETFSCVGCHEDKNSTPLQQGRRTMALSRAPQKLQPLHNISGKPFSYPKIIQPILDKHCVSCHAPGKKAKKIDLTGNLVLDHNEGKPGHGGWYATQRKFQQSYLTLLQVKWTKMNKRGKVIKRLDHGRPNQWVDYYTRLATTELVKPYYAGAAKSGLLKMLREGHPAGANKRVKLSEAELNAISAWIDLNVPYVGEYDEMTIWEPTTQKNYDDRVSMRRKQEEIERRNIQQFIRDGQ